MSRNSRNCGEKKEGWLSACGFVVNPTNRFDQEWPPSSDLNTALCQLDTNTIESSIKFGDKAMERMDRSLIPSFEALNA